MVEMWGLEPQTLTLPEVHPPADMFCIMSKFAAFVLAGLPLHVTADEKSRNVTQFRAICPGTSIGQWDCLVHATSPQVHRVLWS